MKYLVSDREHNPLACFLFGLSGLEVRLSEMTLLAGMLIQER